MRHAHCVSKIHIRLNFDKNTLVGVDSVFIKCLQVLPSLSGFPKNFFLLTTENPQVQIKIVGFINITQF